MNLAARRRDVETVVLDGEAVIYDPVTHRLHHLSPTATTIWVRYDDAATLTGLVGLVAADHGVTPETIRADVAAFVADLAQRQLLGSPPAPGATAEPRRPEP